MNSLVSEEIKTNIHYTQQMDSFPFVCPWGPHAILRIFIAVSVDTLLEHWIQFNHRTSVTVGNRSTNQFITLLRLKKNQNTKTSICLTSHQTCASGNQRGLSASCLLPSQRWGKKEWGKHTEREKGRERDTEREVNGERGGREGHSDWGETPSHPDISRGQLQIFSRADFQVNQIQLLRAPLVLLQGAEEWIHNFHQGPRQTSSFVP